MRVDEDDRIHDPEADVPTDVAALGRALLLRVEELGADLADAVVSQVPFYDGSATVPITELRANCVDHLRFVFTALTGDEQLDLSAADATGRQRADDGVPLATLLAAYRVGFRHIWEHVLGESRAAQVDTETMLAATEVAVVAHDSFAHAATAAHGEVVAAQLVRHGERRAALVDALLSGRIGERATVWELAGILGLGVTGPYVAVSMSVATLGQPAIAGIEEQLMSRDLASVWLLRPERQIGIVEIRQPDRLAVLTDRLRTLATAPVGVSAPFDDLNDAHDAVVMAEVALQSARAGTGMLVRVFEDSPLALAASGSPEMLQRVARNVFARLDEQRPADRDLLIETLSAWLDAGGSTAQTAEALFLHPNTVRQRLHRLEEYTGRSISDPRQVAELCLALEVRRRWAVDSTMNQPMKDQHRGGL
ncbi:helix-turn-helix domain-containing protein [Nocardioides sp. WS12]|uniref:PucR family transcriptional regulator n=1 Tax=Nocardioides sp. WS12 TaxID=2486272 RepID=UPI0015FB6A6D|nr:helix-turn-helix domain-containing protein [Nocardioides sp. WS12]